MTTRPVIAKRDGKATKIYRSLAATTKDGYDPSTVSKVLRGERDTHNGHTFQQFRGRTTQLMDAMGNREIMTVQAAGKAGIRI